MQEARGGYHSVLKWQRVWILVKKYICNVCKHCRYIFVINVQEFIGSVWLPYTQHDS